MLPVRVLPTRALPIVPQVTYINLPKPVEERSIDRFEISSMPNHLIMAIERGNCKIIEYLLLKGEQLDPNYQFPQKHRYAGINMLQVAILLGSCRFFESLVRQKTDFDPNARFPSNHVFYANMTLTQVVVDHSIISNRKRLSYHFFQQLSCASEGREEVPALLNYLAMCGADLNKPFPENHPEYAGMSIVHVAILTRRLELLYYLKKCSADFQIPFPKSQNLYSKMTPMQAAIACGDLEMVKIL